MSEVSTPRPSRSLRGVVLTAAVALLVGLALLSLCVGARQIALGEVWRALTDPVDTSYDHIAVRTVRVPRMWLAMVVGAALAVAGALVQTLTRNPLAEPGLLGVSAGASFAIVLSAWWWQADGQVPQMAAASLGAIAATVLVYVVGRDSPARLILAGVALSSLLAGLSLGIRLRNAEAFDNYRFWSVGSLAGREQVSLVLPVTVIVLALLACIPVVRSLNAIALGEEVARTLGVNVLRARVLTIVLVTVLAGAATAVAGPIVFVGLIVPHLVRRIAGGSIPWLVGYCVVLGPALLLAADVLGRVLLPTGEVPVAIVTSFLGGPALIWVVRRYGVKNL